MNKQLRVVLLAGLIGFFAAFFGYRMNEFASVGWEVPFAYEGDVFQGATIVKTLIEGKWWPFALPKSNRLAAPYGMNFADYPMLDHGHFLVMRIFGFFTQNPFLVLNLYYMLGFFLASAAMAYCLLKLGSRSSLAVLGGLIFAILPCHFNRYVHIFLASYFMVPLGILAVLQIWREPALLFKRSEGSRALEWNKREMFWIALLAFGIGSTGVYYALFTCFFLAGAGVLAYLKVRTFRPLLSSMSVISFIGISVLVNMLPYWIEARNQGPNVIVSRQVSDTDTFGLRMTSLLAPMGDHRILPFREIKKKFPDLSLPVEGTGDYVGIAVLIGLAVVSFALLGQLQIPILPHVGALTFLAIALGTRSGIGMVVSALVDPTIRSYNRISVFIAAFGVIGFVFGLQRVFDRMPRLARWQNLLVIPLGVLAAKDQISNGMKVHIAEEYFSDRDFIAQIESQYSHHRQVLQLPYTTFPEDPGNGSMTAFSHAKGVIFSQNLKWSFGQIRNRPGEQEIMQASTLPVNLERVKSMGYDGVYIDRFGFANSRESLRTLEASLNSATGQVPLESRNKRLVYFSLR